MSTAPAPTMRLARWRTVAMRMSGSGCWCGCSAAVPGGEVDVDAGRVGAPCGDVLVRADQQELVRPRRRRGLHECQPDPAPAGPLQLVGDAAVARLDRADEREPRSEEHTT